MRSIILLITAFSAAPAYSWDALPVGDSASAMESGPDYIVTLACRKEVEQTLFLEILRPIPPIDEISQWRKLIVDISTETGKKKIWEIDVTFKDDRDIRVEGTLALSPGDLDLLVRAEKMIILDPATGKEIFQSNMVGIEQARSVFAERCRI